jgi:SPASM domain peptide maturase of grasp-with-spasm system
MAAGSVFKLYANCVPVRGARRSLICDLQTGRGQFIPNALFRILTEMEGLPMCDIKRQYEDEESTLIDEYFSLLVGRDYGFWCDEPELFPALDLSWDKAGMITNAIIDVDQTSNHSYLDLFSQLDSLGCRAVQVRAYDPLTLEKIGGIVQACESVRLRHLDLIVKFQDELSEASLSDLCLRHQLISRVIVHSSPYSQRLTAEPLPVLIIFDPHEAGPSSCGEVGTDYFSVTLEHFTEALQFNTCLNRKISIDVSGDIKNCPAMQQSLGNVKGTRLAEAVKHPVLIQLGRITKDQIEVCRDCEFRYVCTDCRAYTRDAGDPYSKPAKCAYDPYTATWSDTGAAC